MQRTYGYVPASVPNPSCRADEGGLIDLEIGHAMAPQIIPVPVGVPRRSRHGAGLVRRPETEGQSAPQLVAMLHEHARQFHFAGVACGVVGCGLTRPAILMAADQHEIILLGRD